MDDTEACLALNMVPNLGPVKLRRLLEVFSTPQQVLSARAGALKAIDGIGNELAEAISNWEKHVDLGAELQRIRDFGATVITQASTEYPRELRQIHNPPIVLYVWGTITERDQRGIGMV